jgi:tryptophan-rich sensory protein
MFQKSLICIFICLSLGLASGYFTSQNMDWYSTLIKAPGNPPPWVFAPVWSMLYVLMGTSVALMWEKRNFKALKIFTLQFILNLAWTPCFFVFHKVALALIILIAMWIFILLTIRALREKNKISAQLLFPYLLWVSYAFYLNLGVLYLN